MGHVSQTRVSRDKNMHTARQCTLPIEERRADFRYPWVSETPSILFIVQQGRFDVAAMNTVNVRYFASLREVLGAGERVELPTGATLAELRNKLIARSPDHAAALTRGKTLRCALDQSLCEESEVIVEGVEVAFFPPITGG